MDNHQTPYEVLIDYVSGTLDAGQYARVAEHLSVCDECAKTVASINAIRTLLREDDSQNPSALGYLVPRLRPSSRHLQEKQQSVKVSLAFFQVNLETINGLGIA